MPTHLGRRANDGHAWRFVKSMAMSVRLAVRGEAYCGVYVNHRRQCREPAAVISEIGDAYCAGCWGYKATDRLRRLAESESGKP